MALRLQRKYHLNIQKDELTKEYNKDREQTHLLLQLRIIEEELMIIDGIDRVINAWDQIKSNEYKECDAKKFIEESMEIQKQWNEIKN